MFVFQAESILECLEVSAAYQIELDECELLQQKTGKFVPIPQPPPLMLAYNVNTPQEFLLDTIKRIRSRYEQHKKYSFFIILN